MTAPLVFMDTETTGLSIDDDIWEFAAIRREPDGTETWLHLFIEHNTHKCARLPESFLADHNARFPASHSQKWASGVVPQYEAAIQIEALFQDRPHVVGAVPNFDTERVARLCENNGGTKPNWHYHLIDVENLAVGYLAGVQRLHRQTALITPPWKSDDLAAALGVTITEAERHTAMGDVQWAMRIYDAIMGGAA